MRRDVIHLTYASATTFTNSHISDKKVDMTPETKQKKLKKINKNNYKKIYPPSNYLKYAADELRLKNDFGILASLMLTNTDWRT